MGGMAYLMGKLPGMGQIPDNVKSQMDDKVLVRMEAIINSMTMKERAKQKSSKVGVNAVLLPVAVCRCRTLTVF